ncbi:hypothetical protein [Actinokineospora sp.]|uniref:hypothetical protein n=1 Tax=Actinokineospora sp. TaxID=1872133 RepID=UPI0040380ABD
MSPDDLYALPREDFIPARRELARQARAAGDKDAAAAIEKLAKPTTAAWLVNRLARDQPDAVDDLTALGDDLREAHGAGAGPRLRELTQRRTEVLRDLVRRAGQGEPLSEAVTRELEEMFTAAITDESAGEILRAGRVATVRDLTASGWPGLPVSPAAPRTREPAPRKPVDARSRRDAERRALAEAKAAVKAAASERTEADRACQQAETAIAVAERRVRELNTELDKAEVAELEARRGLQTARRAAKEAERAAGLAWRKLQQVEGPAEP